MFLSWFLSLNVCYHLDKEALLKGGSRVARLNFKTSRAGVCKCLSLIVGFAFTFAIWPREVVSCRDFILRAVATFRAMSLVGIYPGRASIKVFSIRVSSLFCRKNTLCRRKKKARLYSYFSECIHTLQSKKHLKKEIQQRETALCIIIFRKKNSLSRIQHWSQAFCFARLINYCMQAYIQMSL